MPKAKSSDTGLNEAAMRPALNPKDQEDQLIYLTMKLAEKQLREGTASSQVMTYFLKLGSQKQRYEEDLLKAQSELAQAKAHEVHENSDIKALLQDAMAAMQDYSPTPDE